MAVSSPDLHGNINPTDSEEYGAFHVKFGKEIVFGNGRRTAYKGVSGYGGVVYSAKPIPMGEMFQVKILKRSFSCAMVSIS